MTTVVHVDQRALAALARDEGVKSVLQHVGDQVAQTAAARAPRRTGAGAESIAAEVLEDNDGPVVRVSWSKEHFYLLFSEVGTSRMAARPFLRPALDAHYDV